ncbi:MAG: hypothetical protein CL917_04560 [Deltaproteobacteria bacterium]|nr:hypothetical protein [Deltaproteobacteria bacterium]
MPYPRGERSKEPVPTCPNEKGARRRQTVAPLIHFHPGRDIGVQEAQSPSFNHLWVHPARALDRRKIVSRDPA